MRGSELQKVENLVVCAVPKSGSGTGQDLRFAFKVGDDHNRTVWEHNSSTQGHYGGLTYSLDELSNIFGEHSEMVEKAQELIEGADFSRYDY